MSAPRALLTGALIAGVALVAGVQSHAQGGFGGGYGNAYDQGYASPGYGDGGAYGRPQAPYSPPAYGRQSGGGSGQGYGQPPYSGGQGPGYAPPYSQRPSRGGSGYGPGIVPVTETTHVSTVTLGGTVVPYKEVTLSAQMPGRIEYLAGAEGDYFEENDILAELDDSELRAQQQAAWAALRDAESMWRNAYTQYSRELVAPQSRSPSAMPGMGMPTLFDQFFTRPLGSMMGQGSPGMERHADLYGRGTQIEQARNAYMKAQSQLQQLEAKFRDAKSVAPFDGVIVRKYAEVGDTAQPGQPILDFADVRYLQIQVEVPARLMPLRQGQQVYARLDVSEEPILVEVARVFPMADRQRHTVTVKFDIPQGTRAAPGMYAEVSIPDNDAPVQRVVVIPLDAIVQRGSLPMVEVAKEDGDKELRIVRLGEYVDARHVTVLSGLNPGEYIHVGGRGQDEGWDRAPPPDRRRSY